MKSGSLVSAAVLVALAAMGTTGARAQANADLGTIWNEEESGWQGVWTRVGRSNTFQAVWTKGSQVVRANLQMTVQGNTVSISRDDTLGPGVGKAGCAYTGVIRGNTVSGQYNCAWSSAASTWKATISR